MADQPGQSSEYSQPWDFESGTASTYARDFASGTQQSFEGMQSALTSVDLRIEHIRKEVAGLSDSVATVQKTLSDDLRPRLQTIETDIKYVATQDDLSKELADRPTRSQLRNDLWVFLAGIGIVGAFLFYIFTIAGGSGTG